MSIQISALEGEVSRDAFFIRVIGTAMIDNSNYEKSVGAGDLVLFDPHPTSSIQHGDIVLVEIAPDDIRVREYRVDGAEKMLCAYESHAKTIQLTDEMKILGIMIFIYRQTQKRRESI
jgi:SOS-response transcriptional repressor LexA